MSLHLSQIDDGRPVSASLAEKQAALQTWLGDVLALHGTGWTVVGYVDPRLMAPGFGGADRARIMGNPARYAEVIWTGRADGYDPTAPSLTFEVGIYYGTGVSLASATLTEDAAAAETAFRAVCYAASDTVPGVLYAAERQEEIETAGGWCELSGPTNVRAVRIPGSTSSEPLLALAFTIALS